MENTQVTREKKISIKHLIRDHSALFALIILFVLAVALKGTVFLNLNNIINILMNNSIIGVIALGMTMIIITGGIDLSVGSQLAATGLISLSILNATENILFAIVGAVIAGAIFGGITGSLVSKFSIPAFIVTLGSMQIYRSVSQFFFSGGGILAQGDVGTSFTAISNTRLFGILPLPILYWIILCGIIQIVMKKTAFGTHVYSVGSNERATFLSAINVNKVRIFVYSISGILVALASIIEASRLGSMNSASSGSSYEMDAIAAVVIGGTSMSGGKGTVLGTVFGTLTLGIINNMMNLLGVPTFLVGAIKGVIIVGAVLLQRTVSNDKE